ncbi:TetR/AcrR family transcriptional regulator [Nonomuraea dietziae]|uniref:TetR/AcrR family transcriptional regulator n=1 Tax=Nonomuraea dietziae TaxID=65515 RepID=UPI0033D752F2
MVPPEDSQLLDTATRLFAAMGYDGTPIEQIAEAAGVGVAELRRAFGGKRELYLAVMERCHQTEQASLDKDLAQISCADPAAFARSIHFLIDGYIDFAAAHPYIHALWMHRWLSDAIDVEELEFRYARPLYTAILETLQPGVAAGYIGSDVDVEYVLHSLMWCVHGFGQGGVPDSGRNGFSDPRALHRFRANMHQMVHRTLRLPENHEPRF